MKKQRFLYLVGVLGAVGMMMGVLFLLVSPRAGGRAVSGEIKQEALADGWLTAVSTRLKEAEYAISAADDAARQQIAYQSPNRAQNLRTYFSETGIEVEPRLKQGADWNFGLELVGVGDGLQTAVPEIETHAAVDNRVTLDYGKWQAWYVNEVRGVEQGFTIEEPLFGAQTGLLQIDMALTGDLVPQWVSADEVQLVTAVGEQVLTYQGLYAYDAQGTDLPAAMELVDLADGRSGIRLSVDVAAADYPIVVDPFLGGGVDWEGWLDQDANYGFAVSTAGDVNQDGFDDVLVGANWFDNGEVDEGAVFAYYGGPEGLPQAYQWQIEGNVAFDELGFAVNPAGDVNQDGFDDVIIGTNLIPRGKAYVYLGTAAGLSDQPIWTGMGEQDGDEFGTAVNTAGDVNGDGYDDIIIGAPSYDINGHSSPDGGRAYVFSGLDVKNGLSDPTLAWQAENDLTFSASAFGFSVGTAGDVDQNGFADVIIGAPYYAPDGISGYAGIFSGTLSGLPGGWVGTPVTASTADWYTVDFSGNSYYGFSVGLAGDVNGDGYDDVIVGAPNYAEGTAPPTGAAFVFTGTNPIGNMDTVVYPYTPWGLPNSVANARFGHAVGTAGDVDLDGYDDVIVGAPQFDNDAALPKLVDAPNGGGAFVYRGAPSGFASSWEVSSNVADAKLGTSVGTAGDVNGDGYADIIVGAPVLPSPGNTAGEALSFYGSGQISNFQVYNDSPTSLGSSTKLWVEIDAGGVLGYSWDLGDGAVAEGPVVDHVYTEPGYYTAVVLGTSLTDQVRATTAVTISESSLIDPVNGGHLEFVNPVTGFGTKVDVPPGAVSEVLKLSYTPLVTITQPSPPNSLGYYFDLDAAVPDYQVFLPVMINGANGGGGTAVAPASTSSNSTIASYVFAKPVTVTIVYNDTGLTPAQEEDLKLSYWNKVAQEWIDIAGECGLADTYTYYPNENYFTVQVCHLSRFSVAG